MTQDTHHDHSHTGHAHADAETDKQSSTTDKPYTDIVCGMKVKADPQKTRAYEDENYYFCSAGCMDKFDANPASYAHKESSETKQDAPEGTMYTLPDAP